MGDVTDYNARIIEELRAGGGKAGGNWEGSPLLILHHTGAKTGTERVNPVMYQVVDGGFAVFASKGGAPMNPDWFHNLMTHPQVEVEVDGETIAVRARIATDEERGRIWEKQKADYPGFAEYEAKTDRVIPVVILERRPLRPNPDESLHAETIRITGHGGDELEAYHAAPLGDGPYGGVVVIHHMPGYDRETKEIVRRFASMGYLAVMPNLYWREAPGADPGDAAATVRAAGGVPDERLVGDVAGAAAFLRGLPTSNGKVGVIGYCSGGRQSFLSACSLDLDAAVDCYGAFVVNPPPEGMGLRAGPIVELAPQLSCPLLGLFGADDSFPAPDEVAELAKALEAAGKEFEFQTYEGTGHSFFSIDRPAAYRAEAAVDGWRRIGDFFGHHLAG